MPRQIRAAVLNNFVEVSQLLGVNPHPLLLEVGLSPTLLADSERRIATDAVVALLENSAAASGCDTFGLHMAESRQLADFGAVSLSLLHQPTLREALRITMHYRHLLNESLAMFIEDAGEFVLIREEVVTAEQQPARQATELAIGVLHRLCSALLGRHWHPISINFTHCAPSNLKLHQRIFGCPVKFAAEFNGIVCPAADLAYPNPSANPAMAKHAENFIASLPKPSVGSFAEEVEQAIYILLPMGRATIEQVAQALGINARTLQRRLDDDQASFSELINSVRRALVVRYLDNPRFSLGAISEMLGYSVASSFTRWFTSQFNQSPARWRVENCSTALPPKKPRPDPNSAPRCS